MYTVKRRIKFLLTMFLGLELLLLNHCITAFHRTNYSRLIGFIHEKNNRCININVKLWKNCPGFFGINNSFIIRKKTPRRGIEPRSPAWQAGILTTILPRIGFIWSSAVNRIQDQPNASQHRDVTIDSEGQQNVGFARRVWPSSRDKS